MTEMDIRAIVAEIAAEVSERRSAGDYPAELLARLHAPFAPVHDTEPPEVLALIESARPVSSQRRVLAPVVVNGKRALRRLIAWYVRPIAEDQTRFNVSILGELRALERRLGRLETPWNRDPAAPSEAGHVDDRAASLNAVLNRVLQAAPPGDVLLLGEMPAAAPEGSGRTLVDATGEPPLNRLEASAEEEWAAIVLFGVLPRLAARELVELMPRVARALRHGGVSIADAPDPAAPGRPSHPTEVALSHRRWVAPSTASLLCEAAGLEDVSVHHLDRQSGWYAIVAARGGA